LLREGPFLESEGKRFQVHRFLRYQQLAAELPMALAAVVNKKEFITSAV
jgi:hypothetical protein